MQTQPTASLIRIFLRNNNRVNKYSYFVPIGLFTFSNDHAQRRYVDNYRACGNSFYFYVSLLNYYEVIGVA